MESGAINRENLSSILRSLSQRRRQGTLEINEGEKQLKILFFQGKIVEVLHGSVPPAEEVAELLEAADLIKEVRGLNFKDYADLFSKLPSLAVGSAVDETLFKRVIKHRILNGVYALENLTQAYYVFKVQMVEYERDYAPLISVGQVLLDLVALANEGGRFAAAFMPGAVIRVGENPGQPLSEEESVLIELIGEGIGVEQLRRRSMLSRYHFQDALLSMLDRGVVAVTAGPAAQSAAVKLAGEELLAALDRSIDKAFAEESKLVKAKESLGCRAKGGEEGLAAKTDMESPSVEPEEAGETVACGKFGLIGLSSRLGQAAWVPYIVVLIFLASVVFLPWLVWRDTFRYFAR